MYLATPLEEVIRVDQLISLHYFQYTQEFYYGGEQHDFWELVYIDEGEAGIAAGDNGYFLKQGDIIFHKPNEYHNISPHKFLTCAVIFAFRSNSPAMSFFENKILRVTERQKYHISEILKEGKASLLDPLNEVCQEKLRFSPDMPFGTLQLLKTHLEQMLIDMVRENRVLETEPRPSEVVRWKNEDLITRQIRELLQANLRTQITLDEIAAQVGFSKTYVKTLFRHNTGESIMQTFHGMKIEEAKRLISQRKYSVTEISELLGFSSVHYFSRAFKKATGISPSAYSQSVRRRALL